MTIHFDYRFYQRLEPKDREYIRRRTVGRAANYYVLLVRSTRRARKILYACQQWHSFPGTPIIASTVRPVAIDKLFAIGWL